MSEVSQDAFKTCYRHRRGTLFHAAYMRMGKVLLLLRVLRRSGTATSGRSVFDYGFGAGTFYLYCPKSSALYGVEQDPVVVAEVSEMLRARGFATVDLQPVEIGNWEEHPLLGRSYDLLLCSHVLEHLPDPAGFLRRMRSCIAPGGGFFGLVPINERAANPHHVQAVTASLVRTWADESGYELVYYEENDPFLYWVQPLFAVDAGWKHKLAQAVSLGVGLCATACGERLWFALGKVFAAVTCSKPTQAAFVLQPRPEEVACSG